HGRSRDLERGEHGRSRDLERGEHGRRRAVERGRLGGRAPQSVQLVGRTPQARHRAHYRRLGLAVAFVLGCMAKKPVEAGPAEWEPVALPIPSGFDKVTFKTIRGTGPDNIWVLATALK